MTTTIINFGPEWYKLKLELRQRWWKDTDYGRKPPSPEMKAEVHAALEELKPHALPPG